MTAPVVSSHLVFAKALPPWPTLATFQQVACLIQPLTVSSANSANRFRILHCFKVITISYNKPEGLPRLVLTDALPEAKTVDLGHAASAQLRQRVSACTNSLRGADTSQLANGPERFESFISGRPSRRDVLWQNCRCVCNYGLASYHPCVSCSVLHRWDLWARSTTFRRR